MKTVKNSNGEIKRVDDSTAIMMVMSGLWNYCGKEEYKQIRKVVKETPKSETTNDIENRGLSDKKLRKERRRAKSEKNQGRGK
jgi:hypothetical protein